MNSAKSPHLEIREDWLALHTEEIISPEQEIVDAHHHLWDRSYSRYLFDELLSDFKSGHCIIGSVYVQCKSMYRQDGDPDFQSVGEVEFINGVAAQFASGQYGEILGCQGIVGFADLQLGDCVEPVLERLLQAGGGRLKGIRNTTAWHADSMVVSNPNPPAPGLLQTAQFLQGCKKLSHQDLVLDIWAYHTQLSEVYAVALQCPDLVIVLDHVGGPLGIGHDAIRDETGFKFWREQMKKIAQLSNVKVKIGGFGMKIIGQPFYREPIPPTSIVLANTWRNYVEAVIEMFGPQRCMFESNFPVDKGMFSYQVLWNTFKRLSLGYSETERNFLFRDCARETYRL